MIRGRVLDFDPERERDPGARIGRVHPDGSITFQGQTYASVKDLPPDCEGLRMDVASYQQWVRLYGAIAPTPRRRPWRPKWSRGQ